MEVKGNTENLFLVPPAEQLLSSVSLCHQQSQPSRSSSRMPAGGSRAGAVVPVCELSTAHSSQLTAAESGAGLQLAGTINALGVLRAKAG